VRSSTLSVGSGFVSVDVKGVSVELVGNCGSGGDGGCCDSCVLDSDTGLGVASSLSPITSR
jgi:hypothetical protein